MKTNLVTPTHHAVTIKSFAAAPSDKLFHTNLELILTNRRPDDFQMIGYVNIGVIPPPSLSPQVHRYFTTSSEKAPCCSCDNISLK